MSNPGNFTQTATVSLLVNATTAAFVFPLEFLIVPFAIETQIAGSGGSNIFGTVIGGSVTTKGFSVTFSGAIPDGSYYLTYTAQSQQAVPSPAGDGCCGGPNVPNACPVPQIASYLFPGSQGIPGPIALMAGAYNASATYLCNLAAVSVVTYAGLYFLANNPSKTGTATWGTPTLNTGDWLMLAPTSGIPAFTTNSALAGFNIGGASVLTPGSSNDTQILGVSGAIGLRNITIANSGVSANGDRMTVLVACTASAGTTFEFTNLTSGGTQLLPSSRFPGNIITTAGNIQFTIEFVFYFGNWIFVSANLPS